MLEIQFSKIFFFHPFSGCLPTRGLQQKKRTKDVLGTIFSLDRCYICAEPSKDLSSKKQFPECPMLPACADCRDAGRSESLINEESSKFRSNRCRDIMRLCIFFLIVFFLVFPRKKVRYARVRKGAKYALEFSRKHILQHSIKYTLLGNRWQYFNALEKSMQNVHLMANDRLMQLPNPNVLQAMLMASGNHHAIQWTTDERKHHACHEANPETNQNMHCCRTSTK